MSNKSQDSKLVNGWHFSQSRPFFFLIFSSILTYLLPVLFTPSFSPFFSALFIFHILLSWRNEEIGNWLYMWYSHIHLVASYDVHSLTWWSQHWKKHFDQKQQIRICWHCALFCHGAKENLALDMDMSKWEGLFFDRTEWRKSIKDSSKISWV